jgi:hypothetical protein
MVSLLRMAIIVKRGAIGSIIGPAGVIALLLHAGGE